MTARIRHTAGDTLAMDCQAFVDLDLSAPRDITDVTITAEMFAPFQDTIELEVEKAADPVSGRFQLKATADETAEWRQTVWYARISYVEDGVKTSTELFQIEITKFYNAS